MTKQQAQTLAREITRTVPTLQVTGLRRYSRGSWSVDVTDTVSGVPAVYHSREAWEERLQALRFRQEVTNA